MSHSVLMEPPASTEKDQTLHAGELDHSYKYVIALMKCHWNKLSEEGGCGSRCNLQASQMHWYNDPNF